MTSNNSATEPTTRSVFFADRSWTLTHALFASFGLLLVVSIGVVLAFSLAGGLATTRDLVSERAVQLVSSIGVQTRKYLEPAQHQAEALGARIESGTLDVNDREVLSQALISSIAAAPQLQATFFLPPDLKTVIQVRCDKFGKPELRHVDWTSNGRVVKAMRELAQHRNGFWGDIVYDSEAGRTVINYRRPLIVDGQFVGALATAVATADLSDYLVELVRDQPVTAFILVGQRSVLAHTNAGRWDVKLSEAAPLARLSEIPDPVLRQIWSAQQGRLGGFERFPNHQGFRLDVADKEFVFFLQTAKRGEVPWIIGVYTRAQTVFAEFKRLGFAAIAGLVVLILALYGVSILGKRLSRPVLTLARAATDVGEHGPRDVALLPGSRIREIETASTAFNAMVLDLREREQMRETFGRYVPPALVDQLIGDHGVLAPQVRETTTLFTDIVGFASVSEAMTPEQLIGMLNEYFAVVAQPIEAHGGVIHQFQGDAILATFNSPTALKDHQEHAVQAALEIQELVLNTRFATGVELPTRIGINTGEAVCGTVGSGSRLGFTVHGDQVNLAARLEQMNKSLGTRVLVAESTVKAIGRKFAFSRVGVLPVRGRHAQVVAYTLKGPHTVHERTQLRSAS